MSDKKEKIGFKEQFELKTEESCLSAIKNGWVAGLISLVITVGFSVAGFFSQSDDPVLSYLLDPWMFFDAVLISIFVWFIFKKSRIASTLMFMYFLVGKVMQVVELGELQGIPLTIIFFLFYLNAMRATFLWHSKYKVNNNHTVSEENLSGQAR